MSLVNYRSFGILGDGNITAAFYWSQELNVYTGIPSSLTSPVTRANLINDFNENFGTKIAAKYDAKQIEEKSEFLRDVAEFSKKKLNDLSGTNEEIAVLMLKLWSACILICKYIDHRRIEITSDIRKEAFTSVFDAIAKSDPIFSLGMKTATSFCELKKEKYTLDGVPNDSPIMA